MHRLLMGFSWFFALLGVMEHRRDFGEGLPATDSVIQYGKAEIEAG